MHYSRNTFKTFLDAKLYVIFPILISIYLIILYAPMFFYDGSLINTDQPMWTAITYLLKNNIIPEQKWFWNIITDRENAGYLMGSNYSLNLIVLWLLSHLFNPELSVKIFLFLCVYSIIISIYFVSSKISNPIIGLITALLSIPIVFLDANTGMCYTYLSFSFVLLFWLSSLKFLKDFSAKYWMLSVLLATLSIYTHPIGFISCLSIWISLLFCSFKNRQFKPFDIITALYFVIPFISLLLSTPQIFATLFSTSDIGNQQIISSYQGPLYFPTLDKSLSFNTYFRKHIGFEGQLFLFFFGVVGFYSVLKKENQLKFPIISLYVVLFLLVSRIFMLSPIKPNIFYQLTINYQRFFPYLKIVCILIVGIGLHFVYDGIIGFSSKKKIFSFGMKLAGIMIVVASLVLCGRSLTRNRTGNFHSIITFDQFEKKKEISSLRDWLSRNVDFKSSRVYFEDTYNTYPSKKSKYSRNHILALTVIASDIKQIGGWAGGSESAFGRTYNVGCGGELFQTKDFHKLSENMVAENLKLLNCKFIVVHSTNIVNFLEKLYFLEKLTTIGGFTVFEYKHMVPAWGFNEKSKERINLTKISSSGYDLNVNGHTGDLIHLSLAYHPNWKAYYKNNKVPINYNKAFMQIRLPASGNQIIELRYTINKMKPVIFLLIGMIIFIYILFFIRTRRLN